MVKNTMSRKDRIKLLKKEQTTPIPSFLRKKSSAKQDSKDTPQQQIYTPPIKNKKIEITMSRTTFFIMILGLSLISVLFFSVGFFAAHKLSSKEHPIVAGINTALSDVKPKDSRALISKTQKILDSIHQLPENLQSSFTKFMQVRFRNINQVIKWGKNLKLFSTSKEKLPFSFQSIPTIYDIGRKFTINTHITLDKTKALQQKNWLKKQGFGAYIVEQEKTNSQGSIIQVCIGVFNNFSIANIFSKKLQELGLPQAKPILIERT